MDFVRSLLLYNLVSFFLGTGDMQHLAISACLHLVPNTPNVHYCRRNYGVGVGIKAGAGGIMHRSRSQYSRVPDPRLTLSTIYFV